MANGGEDLGGEGVHVVFGEEGVCVDGLGYEGVKRVHSGAELGEVVKWNNKGLILCGFGVELEISFYGLLHDR